MDGRRSAAIFGSKCHRRKGISSRRPRGDSLFRLNIDFTGFNPFLYVRVQFSAHQLPQLDVVASFYKLRYRVSRTSQWASVSSQSKLAGDRVSMQWWLDVVLCSVSARRTRCPAKRNTSAARSGIHAVAYTVHNATLLPVQLIVLQSRPADDCAVCLSFVRLSLCPTPKWKKISSVHNKLHVQLVGNFWGIKSNKATGHRYIGVFRQVYKALSLRLAFSFPFLYSPSLELPSFALLYPTR